MYRGVGLAAALVLSLPHTAFAQGVDFGGDFSLFGLDSFVAGIVSNAAATSSTGGVVSGEAVSTGDADASATIRNIIRGGGENTQIRIDIRTESDGEVRDIQVDRTIPRGERVEVNVATSTERSRAETRVRIGGPALTVPRVLEAPWVPMPERALVPSTWSLSDVFERFENLFSGFVTLLFGAPQ